MRHRPQQFLPMATTGLVTLLIALAAPLAAQDGITALYFADANGNTITQGTSANLHVSTNNVSNYSILVGPDPSTTGGYYGSSCY